MTVMHIISLLIFAGIGLIGMAVMLEAVNKMARFLPIAQSPVKTLERFGVEPTACRANR